MQQKISVGLLFGGRSAEHEVSLESAKSIYEALDKEKYEVLLVGIDKRGRWILGSASELLLESHIQKSFLDMDTSGGKDVLISKALAIIPGNAAHPLIMTSPSSSPLQGIDVVFPALHGPYGEDGSIQGLLKLADIPFVGAGILGSALGMDKDVMKRLLRAAEIPCARHKMLTHDKVSMLTFEEMTHALGSPLFIKPANLGSSVGVSKVTSRKAFDEALEQAFAFDHKILVEEFIEGREIECSVLGNDHPVASVPGEIVSQHAFYSYKAKYIDPQGAFLHIPADLSPALARKVQELAVKTFETLCCEGMARVDCFLKRDGTVLVNEINTIPGFTKISMYPKLWEASGIPYGELLDRLIHLALERHQRDAHLRVSYT